MHTGTGGQYFYIILQSSMNESNRLTQFLDMEGPFWAVFPLFSCLGWFYTRKHWCIMMLSYSTRLKYPTRTLTLVTSPLRHWMCVSRWEHHGKVRWMSFQRLALAYRKSQWAHSHAVKLQQTENRILKHSLPRRLNVLYVLQTLPCWGNLISR